MKPNANVAAVVKQQMCVYMQENSFFFVRWLLIILQNLVSVALRRDCTLQQVSIATYQQLPSRDVLNYCTIRRIVAFLSDYNIFLQ
jgi:hypothetical protein